LMLKRGLSPSMAFLSFIIAFVIHFSPKRGLVTP
jgi:hypothetical protein